MSDHFSTSDWIKHLHVHVAKWEENNCSKRCCLNKRIDDMTHCLTARLSTCKSQGRVPKPYSNEVDRFFEFLKDPKMDTKHISKLVKVRNKTISLLDIFWRFYHFSEEEKQKTLSKFEQKDGENFTKIVQILIQKVDVTNSIQSQQPYREFHDQTLNDTTWLRHMYCFFLKKQNNIPGRVKWRNVHNGLDPNNTHKNPVTGKKEEFLTKERLISQLKLLVPLCMQHISMPRQYKEEIQLLQHYLDSEALNKTKVQSEQKTRKLAMEMTETLLTLLKEGHIRNDVVQNIPPTEVGHLLYGLNDIQIRLLSMANDNLIEHHEDERNERPFHTGSSSVEHSGSSRVDQIYNINDSAGAILSDDASSRENDGGTIHKVNTAEDGFSVLSLPYEQHHQVNVLNAIEESRKLKLVETGDVHGTAVTDCENDDNIDQLDEQIVIDPSIFDDIPDILSESFHSLLQAAKEMTSSSSEVYSDDVLKERCVSEDKSLGNFENFRSLQEDKSSGCSSNAKSCVSGDICTKSTSYTSSNLMVGFSSDMGIINQSPKFQVMEVDSSNDDNILEVWSGLGNEIISSSGENMLKKILKTVTEFKISTEERLQQTISNPDGFSVCSPNKDHTAVMHESRGLIPSSSLSISDNTPASQAETRVYSFRDKGNEDFQYKLEDKKNHERHPSFCATLQFDSGLQTNHSMTPQTITEMPEHSQYAAQALDVSELFDECMLSGIQDSSMFDMFTGNPHSRRKRKRRSLNDR